MTIVPKVSVLMSVRNGAAYLQEAMDSVFAQTLPDFEFILIDNASVDATPAIIAACTDPRLVTIRNPSSLTLTESLNIGLAKARGLYVARLDADDIALPDRLARQVTFMDTHPAVAALGTEWVDFDDSGRESPSPPLPDRHADIVAAMGHETPLAHPTLMLRREPAVAVGGYPTAYAYGQDYALYLELVTAGYELANLPAPPLVRIRTHAQQASLSPEWAVLRSREGLELYTRGGQLPGLNGIARWHNRRRVAQCHLQYSLALWRSSRYVHALLEALRGSLKAPGVAAGMIAARFVKS